MINVWSRIKPPAAASRCLSCASATITYAAHRPSIHQVLRRLRYKHLTTLFYSSVIATAAAADVNVKQKRREQWDTVIAETERGLCESAECQAPRSSPALQTSSGGPPQKTELDRSIDLLSKLLAVPSSPQRVEAELAKSLEIDLGRTLLPREATRVSNSSIYASRFRQERSSTNWTPKKLVNMEFAIAKLATRFLLQTSPATSTSGSLESRPSRTRSTSAKLRNTLKDISERIEQVKKCDAFDLGSLHRLEYPHYSPESCPAQMKKAHAQLNRKIAADCYLYHSGRISYKKFVARLAYNLMVAPIPPGRSTFTLLVGRLSRLKLFGLADIVTESLFESHTRPDEMTISTLLSHYIRKRDAEGFNKLVLKIHWNHYGGLMTARPGIHLDGVGADHLKSWNGKILQRMSLDNVIANMIIKGHFTFGQPSAAYKTLDFMAKDGVEPNIDTLWLFLRESSRTCDWDRGRRIWEQIKTKYLAPESSALNDVSSERSAFFNALRLCKNCKRPQEFREIYQHALQRGHSMLSILKSPSKSRDFSYRDDFQKTRRRKLDILDRRTQLIINDVKQWASQILVAKVILSRLSTKSIQNPDLPLQNALPQAKWSCDPRTNADLRQETSVKSLLDASAPAEAQPQHSETSNNATNTRPGLSEGATPSTGVFPADFDEAYCAPETIADGPVSDGSFDHPTPSGPPKPGSSGVDPGESRVKSPLAPSLVMNQELATTPSASSNPRSHGGSVIDTKVDSHGETKLGAPLSSEHEIRALHSDQGNPRQPVKDTRDSRLLHRPGNAAVHQEKRSSADLSLGNGSEMMVEPTAAQKSPVEAHPEELPREQPEERASLRGPVLREGFDSKERQTPISYRYVKKEYPLVRRVAEIDYVPITWIRVNKPNFFQGVREAG